MKIAFLIDQYVNPHAGTEHQLLILIEQLLASRVEVEMAVLRSSDYTTGQSLPIEVTHLAITRVVSLNSVLKMYKWARELRAKGVSIVQIYFNDSSVLAPWLLKACGLKVVVCRRDMGYWRNGTMLLALRLVSPSVDRIVANSKAAGHLSCSQEWISEEKLVVIPNGISTPDEISCTKASGLQRNNGGRVGIVANIRPIKRIDDLIRSFAIVREQMSGTELVVAGGGDSSMLRELAVELGVAESVEFTGQVSDPISLIHSFDIGVICSESEGLSNSLLQYSLCSKPVIATDCGGNPEVVENERTGLLVPVGDYRALGKAILRLLRDPVAARQMGEAGARKIREEFSVERMVGAHMKLYSKLEGERSKSARSLM